LRVACALCFSGRNDWHNSGAWRRENADVQPTVIARLDRAIQYSEAPMMESKSCGVLDTRFRGYDDGV